jgi:hypothetical protein
MASTVVPTHKRTFDQTGLDVAQVDDAITTPAKEPKLDHPRPGVRGDDQKAALDTLPTEILSHIATHLSTAELLSLRLANRTIEVQLFNDFAAYYFAKKQFMLTPESLQCLLDISRHPKLSTVLEHVIISLDKYSLHTTPSHFHGGDPSTIPARAAKYRQGAYDQAVFLSTGRDRELLSEAFRNLPGLKTVGLRDYNSGMRRRDGQGAQWGAYGATTVLAETGLELLRPDDGPRAYLTTRQCAGTGTPILFAARAFTVVLQALGASGAAPDNVEILLTDNAHALPDHAFHIPPYLEPTVAPVLAGLTSLLLRVNLTYMSVFNADDTGPGDGQVPWFSLDHFLSLTPNLTQLRLNFMGNDFTGNVSSFLEGLAASGPQLLPKLAQLEFGMMNGAYQDRLSRVVERWSGTLKRVGFWKVSLSDSPAQDDALELDSRARPNRWAELLIRLRKVAPGIERIHVGCLSQCCRGHMQQITLNLGSQEEQGRPPVARVYNREDMRDLKAFKQRMEEELKLFWLEDVVDDGSGESSGSEESVEEIEGDEDES